MKQTTPGVFTSTLGIGGTNFNIVADTTKSPKALGRHRTEARLPLERRRAVAAPCRSRDREGQMPRTIVAAAGVALCTRGRRRPAAAGPAGQQGRRRGLTPESALTGMLAGA